MRTDELECIYLHLSSLRHFGSIAERFSIGDDDGGAAMLTGSGAAPADTDATAEDEDKAPKAKNGAAAKKPTRSDA